MGKENPFKNQMVKMKAPNGSGKECSFGGFLLELEEDGTVELPKDMVEDAKSHGFTVYVEEEVKKPKGK